MSVFQVSSFPWASLQRPVFYKLLSTLQFSMSVSASATVSPGNTRRRLFTLVRHFKSTEFCNQIWIESEPAFNIYHSSVIRKGIWNGNVWLVRWYFSLRVRYDLVYNFNTVSAFLVNSSDVHRKKALTKHIRYSAWYCSCHSVEHAWVVFMFQLLK